MPFTRLRRAIERDPQTLAALSHPGIHATRDTIAKSLAGTWQPTSCLSCNKKWRGTTSTCSGSPNATPSWNDS
jgi:hypothetical protein